MNTSLKCLLAVVAIGLPGVAFAQSSDAQYCAALVGKYEQYLDMSSKRGEQPQSLEAKTGVEKCQAGDPAGKRKVVVDAVRNVERLTLCGDRLLRDRAVAPEPGTSAVGPDPDAF